MKNTFRHITVYLLAATVFVATTGLSVHHLYCYCKGEMVTSIFRSGGSCSIAEQKTAKKSCCKSSTSTCGMTNGQHDCTDDGTSEFVKLDVKYLLPTFFDLKLVDFYAPQTSVFPILSLVVFEKNALRWEQDLPPPPPAGKALLPWIQSYLC